ncbi:uncharacterized protein LOC130448620 [Diorhabda sublineata]|uniref:uncharacterized protein LOC130448620 n=1 Tax=Diorhabda sublineata TaxID=1163346 RepID=UPI0024E11E79|nr:uncharacterized protein LOC130448620 [Diorhabda sublineata]
MLLTCVVIICSLSLHVQGNIIYTEAIDNELDRNQTEEYHVEYVLLDKHNPCKRNCILGSPPMICRYQFDVEYYHTLSKACFDCPYNITDCFRKDCIPGDGTKRGIVTVNRKIPGPAIEVCHNDTIVVDVYNKMTSEATAIHWHGQHMKATPYMDGVPYITQCPILPGNTFRYTFKADQPGTHFWHSHIGMQRADGCYGPLIVHVPEEEDPHIGLYDYDLTNHIMVIIDWVTQLGNEVFLSHHHNDGDNKPPTLLINGFGRYKEFENETGDGVPFFMPPARFKVEQGYRYRFRVINAGFLNCPIEMTVDNHTITVISSDGADIKPKQATSLVTYAGERFDFILNADQPKNVYWIRFKGLMDCDERFTKAFQVAVLEYENNGLAADATPLEEVTYENAHVDGLQINPLNIGTEGNDSYVVLPQLESVVPWDETLKEIPDFQYHIAYDFYKLDNIEFHRPPYYGFYTVNSTEQRVLTPQFNHISMTMPSIPLLPQRDQLPDDAFCNKETMKDSNCTDSHCQCQHGIQIPLGAVAEFIFIDEGVAYDANHPIHLHGHAFRVVAMERIGANVTVDKVKQRDADGLIKRNLKSAPYKDTVTVPDGGYTIVRFKAVNPGYWFLHCHLEFHAEIGMALVVQVGNKNEMLPVPRNFPKCGNYLPDPSDNGRSFGIRSTGLLSNLSTAFIISLLIISLDI